MSSSLPWGVPQTPTLTLLQYVVSDLIVAVLKIGAQSCGFTAVLSEVRELWNVPQIHSLLLNEFSL